MTATQGCKILIISFLSIQIPDASPKKLLCYIQTEQNRSPDYRLLPQKIDTDLCTHVILIVDIFDEGSFHLPITLRQDLTSQESVDEILELQRRNPNITWMMSIGGWEQGSIKFSKIMSEPISRSWFIYVIWNYLKQLDFDGIEINWQWPTLRVGGKPEDKTNYAIFIQELKAFMHNKTKEANRTSLLLSVVLPPLKNIALLGFNLEIISREADLLTLMTMDYHSSTDPEINHHAPLYTSPNISTAPYTVASTVEFYMQMGIDSEKMILGIPLYGKSFTLESIYNNKPGSSSDDEGREGFATKNPGTLAYFEICTYITYSGWVVEKPSVTAMGPYAYKDKDWVAYDDIEIIEKKVEFVYNKGLGGVFLWTLDMDDFKGTCFKKFPLATAAKQSLTNFASRNNTLKNNQDSVDSVEDDTDFCHKIKMFLHGVDINSKDKDNKTRAMILAEKGDLQFLRCLVKLGADLNLTENEGRTVLHYAAMNSHDNVLKFLFKQFVDFNATDNENRTALHLAVENNQQNIISAVLLLLKNGVMIHLPDIFGLTALHIAAENGKLPLIELLLAKGANIHAKDNNGRTPLKNAVTSSNLSVVEVLLRRGANVNEKDLLGYSILHWAVVESEAPLVELLIYRGADVHAKDNFGRTSLHYAVMGKKVPIVELLLGRGADIHVKDSGGVSPLHLTALGVNIPMIELLLNKGANVNEKDKDNKTVLMYALIQRVNLSVIEILLNRGAKINFIDNEGQTVLHMAILSNKVALIELLLNRGADINATAKDGQTPLHRAAMWGNVTVVELLLNKGANISAKDNNGQTVLHMAARRGCLSMVELLINKGANVGSGDNQGQTPLDLTSPSDQNIRQLLIKNGG